MYKHKYEKYKNKYKSIVLLRGYDVDKPKFQSMDLNSRLKYFRILFGRVSDEGDCSDPTPEFKTGGHSKIYKKVIKRENESLDVCLKEQKAFGDTLTNLYNKYNNIWREYQILDNCTKLVVDNIAQNLPIMYDHIICENEKTVITTCNFTVYYGLQRTSKNGLIETEFKWTRRNIN